LENQELFTLTGDRARLDVAVPPGEITFSPRMGTAWPKAPQRETVGVDAAVLAAGHPLRRDLLPTPRFPSRGARRGLVEVTAQDSRRAVVIGAAAELSVCEHRAVDIAEFA